MAYYYITNGQPIPFDIAMLAHLETRKVEGKLLASVPATAAREPQTEFEKQNSWTFQRTDASEGLVGGIWPWMRQGWFLLEDYYDKKSALIDPFLIEVASTIAPASFRQLKGGRGSAGGAFCSGRETINARLSAKIRAASKKLAPRAHRFGRAIQGLSARASVLVG